VCGALVKGDLAIDSLDRLESGSRLPAVSLKDLFMAATMGYPDIEPPLDLR